MMGGKAAARRDGATAGAMGLDAVEPDTRAGTGCAPGRVIARLELGCSSLQSFTQRSAVEQREASWGSRQGQAAPGRRGLRAGRTPAIL
jgi:hypothetical protein